MPNSSLTNTQILAFVLGYQGGTVHQVAHDLQTSTTDILDANADRMADLCRRAQGVFIGRGGASWLLLKHLRRCVDALLADYNGHLIPGWLECAEGVCKIASEAYPLSGSR